MDLKEFQSLGGKARAKKLSAARRSEIARMGAWAAKVAREKATLKDGRKKRRKQMRLPLRSR